MQQALARTPVIRLIIAEDEPLIRTALSRIATSFPGVSVLAKCGNGTDTLDAIRRLRPNLVFLDVQMPGGTGLDIVQQIGPANMPMVTFITAYDQHAVQAFAWNAVDQVLKPSDEERIVESLERAASRLTGSTYSSELPTQLTALLESLRQQWPERVVVRSDERFDVVAVSSIQWVESANNYIQLHCGRNHYTMAGTLTAFLARLDPGRFLRVHRGRIVNVQNVVSLHALLGGTFEILMTDGSRFMTGRQFRSEVDKLLRS